MVDITSWMNVFLQALEETFGKRLLFVGLQGSYGRGEATEESDIDTVVILDELSAADLRAYDQMLDTMPCRELTCGFISGRSELMNWEASDLFQFYYDTKPILGSLDGLMPLPAAADVERAILIGACNVFHGCAHNMLYEKSEDILKGLYKSASFVIQAVCFKQTGRYVSRGEDMLDSLSQSDRGVLETFLRLKNGVAVDFDKASEELFDWAKSHIGGRAQG